MVVGQFLASLQTCGIPPSNIHAIGFSLGAHVLSTAAKTVYSSTGVKIDRLTGLDPTGPCFDVVSTRGLHKGDARIVDVTHTDRGFFGTAFSRGDADFNANSGTRVQPECASLVVPVITPSISPNDFMSSLPICKLIRIPPALL